MELSKDEISGRQLIEGMGMPISGGVFRRPGQPGIVVDESKLADLPWYENLKLQIMSTRTGLLGLAAEASRSYVPVNNERYGKMLNGSQRADRYSLRAFVSQKDADGKEIGGGSPDAQALFAASLIEMRIAGDPDRKVWIGKDSTDGHAIVYYEGKSGNYTFDPTKGGEKFVKVSL